MTALPVTVVVPAYDEVARLGAAIASVRAQTAPPAELLVVDDGSTDGTAALAQRLGARVVRKANGGISSARNAGLRAATQPWVAFLDADDRFEPERLERGWRAHLAHPAARFVSSDYAVAASVDAAASSNLARTPQWRALAKERLAPGVVLVRRGDLGRALAVGNFLGTSTVLVERALGLGCPFDESLPARVGPAQLSEDVEWYLRLLRSTDAVFSESVLARYVRRPGSQAAAHARVRLGDAELGLRIVAAPRAYVAGAAAAFALERRHHLAHAASIALRSGDTAALRHALALARADAPSGGLAVASALARAADTVAGRGLLAAARAGVRAARGSRRA